MAPRPNEWTQMQQFLEDFQENFQDNMRRTMAEAIQAGVQAGVQAAFAANGARANAAPAAPQQRHRQHHNPVFDEANGESDDENSFGDDINNRQEHLGRDQQPQRNNDTRWTAGIKVEIPEFHGGSQPEDLLDWIVTVDEFLEFKEVPGNRQVSLIATRFRGHAASWWNQLKLSRTRRGKEKITSWDKLKKHMQKTFIPYNFERLLFQKFHNIRQGTRSVEDYANEFYQILTRVDIQDSEDQLVASFVAGLRPQLQNMLHQFDPGSVAEARQRALLVEQQARISTGQWTGNPRPRTITTTTDDTFLMLRRNCLAPKTTEAWQRTSLFTSTCTVKGKICRFVVNSGCSANVVLEEAVRKLALTPEAHPHPYRLLWMQTGAEVFVSQRTMVSLSIGSFYKDNLYCDIAPMDVSHIILGRPWQ